jgi:UDP-glucose 4-epimerase
LSNNTQATQALADSAIASGTVSSFIFASTAAVYAPSAKAHAESSPLAPTDVYGFSKLAAEQLLHLVGLGRRMTVGIARLFNVYGPGETNPHLIPVVIQQAMRSSRLSLGNLNTRRDYVYTEDVASGIAAILARAQSGAGGIFNLGGGRPRSGREVVSAIAAALSRELVVLEDPDKVRANDRPRLTADVSLAREVLNWAPSWDFDEAMRVVVSDPTQ